MILKPHEYFPIYRNLEDPADSGTYYVQAKIRKTRTDELLETLNLTDNGDQRFSKEYQLPGDSSGEGYYITIETTVYTDSGYTTKSNNYAIVTNEYLVDERKQQGGGGFGGIDLTEGQLKKVIESAIDNKFKGMPKPEFPKQEKIDLSEIIKKLDSVLKRPEFRDADFSSIHDSLIMVQDKIGQIPTEKPDFTEITNNLKQTQEIYAKGLAEIKNILGKTGEFNKMTESKVKKINKIIEKSFEDIKDQIDKKDFNVGSLSLQIPTNQNKEEKTNNINRAERLKGL